MLQIQQDCSKQDIAIDFFYCKFMHTYVKNYRGWQTVEKTK